MASTAFELEETDDDFFDKLVADDDDIICPRPVTGTVCGDDLDEVKAFSNVSETSSVGGESVGDIGFGDEDDEKGSGDEVVPGTCDPMDNNPVVTDSDVPTVGDVVKSSVALIKTEGSAVNSCLTAGNLGVGDEYDVKRVGDEVVSVSYDSLENGSVVTDTNVPTISNEIESSVAPIKREGSAVNSSLSVGDIRFGEEDDEKLGDNEVVPMPCDTLEYNSVVTDTIVPTVSNIVEPSVALIKTEDLAMNSSLSVGGLGFGDEYDVKSVGNEVVSVPYDSLENDSVITDTSVPSVSNVVESSDALIKTEGSVMHLALSVGGLGFRDEYGVKSLRDEVVSVPCDVLENYSVVTDTNVRTLSNVVAPSVAIIETECLAVNSSLTGGVKEIDWSAFSSAPDIRVRTGSYSDFFNNEFGENSEDPFAMIADKSEDPFAMVHEFKNANRISKSPVFDLRPEPNEDISVYATAVAQTVNCQDLNSSQYEDLYPGWRYDPTTGQWHQLDDTIYANQNYVQDNTDVKLLAANDVVRDHNINYLQRTAESVAGSVAEVGATETVSNWNQGTQENAGYPGHMVFDPQYPGWYYDTIVQEWQLLESYISSLNQSTTLDQNQPMQNANILIAGNVAEQNCDGYGRFQQVEDYQSPILTSPKQVQSTHASINTYNQSNFTMWQPPVHSSPKQVQSTDTSVNSYNHSNSTTWQPEPVVKTFNISYNQQFAADYGPAPAGTHHQAGFDPSQENIYGQTGKELGGTNDNAGFQSYVHAENVIQKIDPTKTEPTPQMNNSSSYFESRSSASFPQPPLGSFSQFSCAASDGRSSDGRPPHALVTFGFGGKLIVMRESNSGFANSTFNNEDIARGVVNVFNIAEVVMGSINDSSSIQFGSRDYFQPLCQRSFPGPLVGGSVGSKELNKWIDDKIANSEYSYPDYGKGEISKMLFSLLKISCQYYGKLRSPYGNDQALKDDCPESSVSKLFASDRNHGALISEHGEYKQCLQDLPPEPYSQAIAHEVQKRLVSGRKQEALKCAQEGKLWGPALVLASQLGDENFGETVRQMSLQQLVSGSPLRTLCLLIGGKPADVFSNSTSYSNMSGPFNVSQQPTQTGSSCMLDEWKENLAIITANRTKEDELVIIHLGDCLWKERGQVTAAHICYLVAEANFESHSDSARLCLIGADHWKFPRTYVTPEAIQRTELYEYSKVLGNPQFLLLPFQPYKVLYAHMLAEVGKLSDSLKYCQAIAKSLKTGRDPKVDNWKQLVSSLEERIKTHQQGGYGTNMAPGKLGKLFNFFDNTAHRVVGLPPPVPTSSQNKVGHNEPVDQGPPRVFNNQPTMANPVNQQPPRVFNSQSTMAMSTLIPSASVEPLNEWTGGQNLTALPNRSISEPDFSKSPKKVDSPPKEENSEKKSAAAGSRFSRFSSQILQKTVGLVLKSRPHRQAKLGDKNTFYFDEKLKRWVEAGANPPAEEAALPPPPTTAFFQNGVPDQKGINFPIGNLHATNGSDIKSSVTPDPSPGIPPTPPTANQFSSQGRMSTRGRYVDTFNKGGGTPTNLFQPPSISIAKPSVPFNPSFFIPAATSVSTEETSTQSTGDIIEEPNVINDAPSTSNENNSLPSPPSSAVTMQRFPSMDHIEQKKKEALRNSSPLNPHARRTLSWSGDNLSNTNDPVNSAETTPLRPLLKP